MNVRWLTVQCAFSECLLSIDVIVAVFGEDGTTYGRFVAAGQPFSAVIDTGFWHELNRKKLHEYKLDDSPKVWVWLFVWRRGKGGDGVLPHIPCV